MIVTHAEGSRRATDPCIGRSSLPLRLRAESAVVPMPVRNARRQDIRNVSTLDSVKAAPAANITKMAADLIVKGSRNVKAG